MSGSLQIFLQVSIVQVQSKADNILVTPLSRVVDPLLQGTLKMREGLSGAAEVHTAADVIAAGETQLALLAGQADLEGDAVADLEWGSA